MYKIFNGGISGKLSSLNSVDISDKAAKKLELIKKYYALRKEGLNEEKALFFSGIKRSNFYRWNRRLKQDGAYGLEDRSKRAYKSNPNKKINQELKNRIYSLRKKYPMFGKEKISVLLKRQAIDISASTVGRVLKELMDRGKIKPVSFLRGEIVRKRRRKFTKHAKRWKYGMKAKSAGELVQIDHMSVNHNNIGIKHFQATCPVSKLSYVNIYRNANSKNAKSFLEDFIDQYPVAIKSIQVDGGSEFMSEFEQGCKDLNIPLYVLPPRKPKYNGNVERTNGTFRYECYHSYDLGNYFEEIRSNLKKYEDFYNNERPHQAIDYLTPREYFDKIQQNEHKKVSFHMN